VSWRRFPQRKLAVVAASGRVADGDLYGGTMQGRTMLRHHQTHSVPVEGGLDAPTQMVSVFQRISVLIVVQPFVIVLLVVWTVEMGGRDVHQRELDARKHE
jgi:hypothetical protein